jgi:hypothetical protein
MHKWILSILLVALVATPAMAFKDVPPNHWAYDAINKAVQAGILQGYNNMFHGAKTLNRFQMAVVVARMLDKMPKGGAGVDSGALKQLEALVTEFADELALLNVKVGKLEETCAKGPAVAAPTAAPAALGSVSIGDGSLKMGGIFKNWYHMRDRDLGAGPAAATDNEHFELRNARLLFWHTLTDDIKLFVQTEHTGLGGAPGGDILDVRATIKLPNSDNYIDFGRFLPPVTAYMHKNITQLDFIDYPIGVYRLGLTQINLAPLFAGGPATAAPAFPYAVPLAATPDSGTGIWRQDGLMFSFGKDTTFRFGIFDGNGANTGANATLGRDDEDKAFMLAVDFKGTEKLKGSIWLWQDEATNNTGAVVNFNEYDAMGLWVSYKHSSFDFMVEYMKHEWDPVPVNTVAEATSLMCQFIVPMQKNKTDFMLRWEQYDAETQPGAVGAAAERGDHDRITIGFRWKMHERAQWQLEYWDEEFNGGNVGVVGAGVPGNEPKSIVTQLMLWF